MATITRSANFKGLDLKATDINRGADFSTDFMNVAIRQTGAIEKRRGWKYNGDSVAGLGLFKFPYLNVSGVEEQREVAIGQKAYLVSKTVLTVTYSGSEASAFFSLFYNPTDDEYQAQIYAGTGSVTTISLGLGIDEIGAVSVADLKTAIDAVTDFSASVTGDDTVAAAFLTIVRDHDLVLSGACSVYARYLDEINSPIANVFSNYYAAKDNDDFEWASSAVAQNCLYIATGKDELMKYDGNSIYRAGLPSTTISVALGASGGISGSHVWAAQVVQYDEAGNLIEGNWTDLSDVITASNHKINVTVGNILAASGFNTNCGLTAGAQSGVTTLNVDNGSGGAHSLKVGDTAYFKDSSGTYHERKITNATTSTITIEGAAVTVSDNEVISANLRLRLLRSKTGPTEALYIVTELANNSYTATQLYIDATDDVDLGAEVPEPVFDRSPPRVAKYIADWNGVGVLAGDPEFKNAVYLSSYEGFEYWPATGTHQYSCASSLADSISGLKSDNEVLYVLKDSSFWTGQGDAIANLVRFAQVSGSDGCVSNASIVSFGGVVGWISSEGPRFSQNGSVPAPLGPSPTDIEVSASRVDPLFLTIGKAPEERYQMKRIRGVDDAGNSIVLWMLPCESEVGGEKYSNANSRVLSYNYSRDSFGLYSNFDFTGGIIRTVDSDGNPEIVFLPRRSSGGVAASAIIRQHNLNDQWDFADHNDPVGGSEGWMFCPQWETGGDPSQLKSPSKIELYFVEQTENDVFTLDCSQEINFVKGVANANFQIVYDGLGYGEAPYGVSSYGDPADVIFTHDLNQNAVKSFRICFENSTIFENVALSSYTIGVNFSYRESMGQ